MCLVELARCFTDVNDAVTHSLHLLARSSESLARSSARLRDSARAIRRTRDLLDASLARLRVSGSDPAR
jgi:hypothetical protein